MKIIRDSDAETVEASVLTTGAFDGVHVGHQTVIKEVQRRAAERRVASAVVTFDKHPALVVRPETAPKLLTRLPLCRCRTRVWLCTRLSSSVARNLVSSVALEHTRHRRK